MRTLAVALVLSVTTSCSSLQLGEGARTKTVGTEKHYRNPFIFPKYDMADPDVIKVNGTYYMYPTWNGRGFDVFTSTNLLNWTHSGKAWVDHRGGAWAPDVFHNQRGDGKFYLYYTDNPPDWSHDNLHKQIGVAVADSPLGPFVDKASLASPAIDAEMFQDDDGQYYLYYVDLSQGFKIMVQPMADPLTKKGEPKMVIHPTQAWEKMAGEVTEGPFVFKRKGTYYLMYSGSGANSPFYGIGYATSNSPLGPFTKHPGNPIARRDETVLGPGHHCVIEGPDKNFWLVYHQKWTEETSFRRFLAIDPIWFDQQGIIHTKLSRDIDQPAP